MRCLVPEDFVECACSLERQVFAGFQLGEAFPHDADGFVLPDVEGHRAGDVPDILPCLKAGGSKSAAHAAHRVVRASTGPQPAPFTRIDGKPCRKMFFAAFVSAFSTWPQWPQAYVA